MQRFTIHSLVILISIFVISCGTDALQISGEWQFEGLEGVAINKIIPSSYGDQLILATDNGVFVHEEGQLTPAGLQDGTVVTLVEMGERKMLAGTRIRNKNGVPATLFKTTDGGETWLMHMGNYGGEERKYITVNALAVHPDNPKTLYARGMLNVTRSVDGGHTWENLYYDWDWITSYASLLKIDPNKPDIIWAGGANAGFRPNLMRTTDDGKTWENMWRKLQIFEFEFESITHSIVIRPGRSSHLLLGLDVGIFRSTDLGESWESVFDGAAVLSLANSPRSSRTVYGSGINQNRALFLLVTPDFGTTWAINEMEDSPGNIHTNDLVVVEKNGREVLYFGTNKGLFSYRIDK